MVLIFCCLFAPLRGNAQNPDIGLLRRINLDRNRNLDRPMELISDSEYAIGVGMPVSVCLAAWIRRDGRLLEKGVNMSLAMVLNTAQTWVLKRAINRPRPAASYPDIQTFESSAWHSFPSGHTSNAFVAATSLSLNFRKWYVVVPAYAWAGAVGYSRLHLGAHYPTDVVAGALVGAGSAFATYHVNRWLKRRFVQQYTPPGGI
jgi:membrane-associated phospholipid phosphatase